LAVSSLIADVYFLNERNGHMDLRRKAQGAGFTMIELLVVIGIISLLAAILLPALRGARNTAKRVVAISQMDNIGVAITNYATDFGVPFPSSITVSTWANPDGDVAGLGRNFSAIDVNMPDPFGGPSQPSGADADELFVYFLGTEFQKTNTAAVGGADIKAGPYMEFKSDVLDRDADSDGFPELLDPWGYSYAYVPYYEYKTPGGAYQRGTTVGGGTDISRGFYNAQTFQIMCKGLDNQWDLYWAGASTPYITTGDLGKPLRGTGANVARGGDDFANWN